MFVQKPSDEGFFALNKDIGRLFNPTVSGGCVCNAYLTESFLGSMASAKYLMLSSERNVKKSLEIRLSKTSQEHLQIWLDKMYKDVRSMYSIYTLTT